jgi:hypothetical protein
MTEHAKHPLRQALEAPIFNSPPITYMEGEKIVDMVRPILKERICKTKYDRVELAKQFLDCFFDLKNKNSSIKPLDALAYFRINSTLSKSLGNSCVGLSLDLIAHLPKEIKAYPAAATLSNRYQQFAGPLYCHVTPLIKYHTKNDQGYVLLDPSFHIAEPILVRAETPFNYDMGHKKGIWAFYMTQEFIHCQAKPHAEEEWTEEMHKDNLMVYRTDEIKNPEASSAMPMFVIDRSYPLVSRYEDGSQRAHINIEMNKKEIKWKVGEEKKNPISFEDIKKNKITFDKKVADFLLIDYQELNQTVKYIVENYHIFDELYATFLKGLPNSNYLASLLKDKRDLEKLELSAH